MTDAKISALTAATTPLAGTEVLPIVQTGVTKKVSIADVTAGRAVAALSLSTTSGVTIRCANNTQYEMLRYVGGANNPGLFGKVVETGNNAYFGSSSSTSSDVLHLGPSSTGNDSIELDSAGNANVKTGNLKLGTAGKGIDFSANGGDVLSQYDEGTWVPTFSGWSVSPTSAGAFYTRVGRQVTINLLANGGVTTGAAVIEGLPFTSNALQGASTVLVALNASSTTARGVVINSSAQISYISAVNFGTDYWCLSVTYIV